MGDAPSFSMVGRIAPPRADSASPGPVYSPRAKGQMGDGSQYTFGTSRGGGAPIKTPGPGDYETHTTARGASSIGDQPKYGFGTSTQREPHRPTGNRFISSKHSQTSNFGLTSPGPMVYQQQDGFNTQLVESPRKNSPRYSFRPKLPTYQTATASPAILAKSPGPGSYNAGGAFGPQVRAGLKSAGSYSFGSSERQSAELNYKKTTYMGKDFHHANLCVHSPGPLVYPSRNTIGTGSTNAGAKFNNVPSFSFGTESRFGY